jgi:hypothetical protein
MSYLNCFFLRTTNHVYLEVGDHMWGDALAMVLAPYTEADLAWFRRPVR